MNIIEISNHITNVVYRIYIIYIYRFSVGL